MRATGSSKMFKYLVKAAGLETDAYGQAHTTYSLRHSSSVFRSLKPAETTYSDWRRMPGPAF